MLIFKRNRTVIQEKPATLSTPYMDYADKIKSKEPISLSGLSQQVRLNIINLHL